MQGNNRPTVNGVLQVQQETAGDRTLPGGKQPGNPQAPVAPMSGARMPLLALLDKALRKESTMAGATPVPREGFHKPEPARTRSKELVADRGRDSGPFRNRLRNVARMTVWYERKSRLYFGYLLPAFAGLHTVRVLEQCQQQYGGSPQNSPYPRPVSLWTSTWVQSSPAPHHHSPKC